MSATPRSTPPKASISPNAASTTSHLGRQSDMCSHSDDGPILDEDKESSDEAEDELENAFDQLDLITARETWRHAPSAIEHFVGFEK